MIDTAIERARLLLRQSRPVEAEKELQKTLASDPNNVDALTLLSLCKVEGKRYEEAEHVIKIAISLDPSNTYCIYVYSRILLSQEKYAEAEKHIRGAIGQDPDNPVFWGLLAAVYLEKKEWEKALEYADKGLEKSPDDLTCLNIRSTSLIKLGRKEDSYNTIREALNYDPNNAITHTNLGWGLLERGDHRKALEHFRKALQEDPQLENAKHGLVEALKARYWIYRIFLKYAFWISNMKSGGQWGVLIGFYIGSRVVRGIAQSNPGLRPFLMPLIFLYVLFAISTWIIGPLTNLFLRLNPYGRYALSKKEIQASSFVGISLGIGLLAFLLYLFVQKEVLFMAGIFGVSMMIPLASMLVPEKKNKRLILIGYTAALGLTGLAGMYLLATGNENGNTLTSVYVIGIILYQWVANAINIK